MIVIRNTETKELFELVSIYLAARPYDTAYIMVVPYPNVDEYDSCMEPSYKFEAISAAPMNGDFCKHHDMDRITLASAGIEFASPC